MLTIFAMIKGLVLKLARIGRAALGREQDMVRIRLRRQGSKGQPSYRIVVIDQRKARNGKYLENIGHYNPRTRPATEVIKEGRALYWLSVGAQPSDPVRRILDHTGTWERFARLKAGESMKDLIKEAEENRRELPNPKTKYPSPGNGEGKTKPRDDNLQSDAGKSTNGRTGELNGAPVSGQGAEEAEETDDLPSEPDKLSEPKRNVDAQNLPTEKTPEAKVGDSDLIDRFAEAFDRPGKTQLNDPDSLPNPLKNPDLRLERKKKQIQENIRHKSDKSQRQWKLLPVDEDKRDEATKNFLNEEYGGCCQICDFTFPKRNGEPHFVAAYIIKYKTLDDPANALCLCPNHFAMFKHGAIESRENIIEQIKSYDGDRHHSVKFQLIGKEVEMRFKERHIIDLIAFLESAE